MSANEHFNAYTDGPVLKKASTQKLLLDDLSRDEQDKVVSYITTRFNSLDNNRANQKTSWEDIEPTVRHTTVPHSENSFTSLVTDHVQALNTITGHFWARTLQTPTLLFDVVGMDSESQKYAPLYKANLVDFLNKDTFQLKVNKMIELDGVPKGVCIAKVEYKQTKQTKQVPRNIFYQMDLEKVENIEEVGNGELIRFDTISYNGPTIKRINPYNFVFDTTVDFDSAFKVERDWVEYQDLVEAEVNGQSVYKNLQGLEYEQNKQDVGQTYAYSNIKGPDQERSTVAKGYDSQGRIELLRFFGDIKVYHNGKYFVLRNYMAVVAANTKLILFEPNMYMFNPFQKFEYRPTESGWGESILLSTLGQLKKTAEHINLGADAATISIQPPVLAPEGAIDGAISKIGPGSIIRYKINPAAPNQFPVPIPINPKAPFDYVEYFGSNIEATTGATRQMSGNTTTTDKEQTATEYQGLQMVGNLLLDHVVDVFNLEFKLGLIEKFSMLLGYYNPVERDVLSQDESGNQKLDRIPQQAYFGEYHFALEDSKSEQERKGLIQQRVQLIQMMLQDPEMNQKTKKIDLFKAVFADLGYGNPDGLFYTDEELAQKIAENQQIQMMAQQEMMNQVQPHGAVEQQVAPKQAVIMPPQQDATNTIGHPGTF